ncbi:hypothetical protein [Streptomyces sp. AD55]|uniref:hypothetical protein n=1 Tax=Streptomyces sp. AD55 TaxID=3242895 RepID=UPI0035279A88
MGASKAQRAAAAKKRAEATQLRVAGVDWATIAERVGYASPGAACTAVNEALKANLREQDQSVEELRALGVAKVNRLQAAFWADAVVKKDPKAGKLVLECIKQEARFQGTEAPTRINMEAQRLADEILAVFDEGASGTSERT